MNLQRMTCLSILLLGIGASALHATEYSSSLDVMAGKGVQMNRRDRLISQNTKYVFCMDDKGHAVIYSKEKKRTVWDSPRGGDFMELQSNGHIVLYTIDKQHNHQNKQGVWGSGAHRENVAGARYVMENDGNLKVFILDSDGKPIEPEIWNSNSH